MRVASILFGLLLTASLGLKLMSNRADGEMDLRSTAQAMAAELGTEGFAARVEQRGSQFVVLAGREDCRMVARDYTPYGTMREVWEEKTRHVGAMRYVWRGEMSAEPPKVGPLFALYLQRELFRVGVQMPRSPVIALAASASCALPAGLWREAEIWLRPLPSL